MERHLPELPAYVEIVHKLSQAIFYCYNESSERLAVGMINGFTFKNDCTLSFSITYFPPTEQIWNVFGAELHFYKKGIPFSVVLYGVASINDVKNNLVQFTIQNAEYFGFEDELTDKDFLSSLFKPYVYLYRKSSELISHSFIKRGITTSLSRTSVNA
ncbi:MAG TPA: hypothetical protein VH396_11195 [Chitinophagaceae bacterium]|jgi:hypothetical protein